MAPPPARRESTADVVHGVTVADPYRWLEDGESAETIAWVEEQNARTRQVIDARPDRERWHRRAAELLSVPISYGCRLGGDVVFSLERGGGRRQAVLVARSLVDATVPARVLLDPADLADDDTG